MKWLPLLICLIILFSCSKAPLYNPSDQSATTETIALYKSMQRLTGAGIMLAIMTIPRMALNGGLGMTALM